MLNFWKLNVQFSSSLYTGVCGGPGKSLEQLKGTLEHPFGRTSLPVAEGRGYSPFLCTAAGCWGMAVCCAATRQPKVLSCWHHWGSDSCWWRLELVSLRGPSWRHCISLVAWGGGWWHWCKEVPVRSRKVELCLVLAGTTFTEPHQCLGCQAMCRLEVQTQEGTSQQAVLRQLVCRQKDEREPLNLLSSVLLLQAIRAWLAYFNQLMERGCVFLLKYFGRCLMWTRSVCLLLVWGFHISHVH